MFRRLVARARSALTLVEGLSGRLFDLHERLRDMNTSLGEVETAVRKLARERRERRYPVTVHVFGARGADFDGGNVSTIRRESPICVYAKTVFLCAGGRDKIEIQIQENVEAGAWLFVSGPAVATDIVVGKDCQLAPYDGTASATVCLLRSALRVGHLFKCELRSTIERSED